MKSAEIDSQAALARAEAAAKTGNVIEYNTAIVALRQAEAVLNDAMSERALAVYNTTELTCGSLHGEKTLLLKPLVRFQRHWQP